VNPVGERLRDGSEDLKAERVPEPNSGRVRLDHGVELNAAITRGLSPIDDTDTDTDRTFGNA
jgi:hypothetical protein